MSARSPICRICLSKDDPKSLIAPCKCKGSVKYVHSSCLTQWRNRLLKIRTTKNSDRCTSCKFEYIVRKKKTVRNILNRGDVRVTITCGIVIALLIPSGYMMKFIIMLTSAMYSNDETVTKEIFSDTITNASSSIWTLSSFNLPFCATLTPSDINLHNELVLSSFPLLLIKLFPTILDAEFWFGILCRPEIQHLHLGVFFLGSVSNIYTAYTLINELFDMFTEDRREFRHAVLLGVCFMVITFWFHYTVTAFRVSTTQEFLQELPVWILRWITISLALFDFGFRRIFFHLSKTNFDDVEIMSVQSMDFNLD
ncbi:7128_t:CDS:2 [Dentiscutata heterogama]|uniref:7128_t:CDS:1 n=1 Tax=Dentiscutata heterogama TaxID=1316150 RepID=A0ACA9NHX9_9GLOM|nr:7128_t:CDS:2 [Dentiscutata heterogama]